MWGQEGILIQVICTWAVVAFIFPPLFCIMLDLAHFHQSSENILINFLLLQELKMWVAFLVSPALYQRHILGLFSVIETLNL